MTFPEGVMSHLASGYKQLGGFSVSINKSPGTLWSVYQQPFDASRLFGKDSQVRLFLFGCVLKKKMQASGI